MRKLLLQILSLTSSFLLLAANFTTPLFADLDVEISGNGEETSNFLNLDQSQTTTVTQSNESNISSDVSVSSNTGGNEASGNTGGDTTVTTGGASTDVTISNTANNNTADVNTCCSGDTSATISNNGTASDNTLNLNQTSQTTVDSSNIANIANKVSISANTGGNTANANVGSVAINTGNITVSTNITNTANSNQLSLEKGLDGSLFTSIADNGSDTSNELNIAVNRSLEINNLNLFNVFNWAGFDLNTGGNTAHGNAGDVLIGTGDILASINISNNSNSNVVDVDCCAEVSPSPQPTPTPEDGDEEDEDEDEDDDNDDEDEDEVGAGPDDIGGPGGQILGLGPTGGDPLPLFYTLYLLGFAAIAVGAYRMYRVSPQYLPHTAIIPESALSVKLLWQSQTPSLIALTLSVSLMQKPAHKLRLVRI